MYIPLVSAGRIAWSSLQLANGRHIPPVQVVLAAHAVMQLPQCI
jgi:hypothetical protein